jgi:hypothetical protein
MPNPTTRKATRVIGGATGDLLGFLLDNPLLERFQGGAALG